MKAKRQIPCSRTLMALAMLGVFGPAWADENAVAQLANPDEGWVSIGGAGVSGDSKDRSLFGQYNGLRKDDAYLMLDFGYVKRDPATGTWTIVEGRDLGLTTREVRGQYGPQGNWKIFGEYSELTRYYPRTVNTSMQGAGTPDPVMTLLPVPGTGSDLDLKTERKKITLGGEKRFSDGILFQATFTSEDKDGARLWGRGFTCPSSAAPTPVCTALASGANQWALLMVPEPISSTTRQIEAKLNFTGEKYAVIAGYYGSFYDNDYGTVTPTVNGNLNNGLGVPMGTGGGVPLTDGLRNILQLPMALPPDNQAHQFSLDGNYAFTSTTRANFRYAYTHATQNESFGSMGLSGAPPGRSDLGGVLDTNLAQAAITSHPMPKLSLMADVRYQDRKDKTPIDLYNIEGTTTWTNGHIDNTRTTGKAEASYELAEGWRGILGLDFEKIDRGEFVPTDQVAGLSALRQNTYERGYRVELQRTMSDTFTGRVSYVRSDRDGSSWLKPLSGSSTGVIPADPDCTSSGSNACIYSATGIFPYIFMDRKRDKVRAMGDWEPMENLSVQLSVDYGKDEYSAPTTKGLDHTKLQLYGIDVAYRVSETIQLKAYYSYSEQSLKVAHSTGYIADLKDKNDTAGFGIVGQANPRLKWGGDVMFINDRNIYQTGLDAGASASNVAYFNSGLPFIPDALYRDLRFKLYGTYSVQKNGDIRFEIVHDRAKLDEWTWGYNGVPFLYSDNTTVNLQPEQNVTFVSLVYQYRWK
ncbi:MAG TPA: MtrB/PioB family decaheme-associated outer membrane protein [Usitatibacter sp.]|nr:MtrB/PioB family decaheme-associated outer membrane protein [Usitatibacter sp.]